MEDWDEEFEPALPSLKKEPPKAMWEDEDAEDEDVKESWEDEEPKQAPKRESKEENTVARPAGKAAGKKTKQPEAKAPQVDDDVLADPVAEKLRQQRLVEEADYKATTELFGKKGDEKSLDNFIPKSESDFAEYADLLSHKIRPYEKSFHYISLLKAVIRLSMTSLKAADAKDIASSVTAIANEKLKAEKEANAGKKKQGGKKKQLLVDKPDDDLAGNDNLQSVDLTSTCSIEASVEDILLIQSTRSRCSTGGDRATDTSAFGALRCSLTFRPTSLCRPGCFHCGGADEIVRCRWMSAYIAATAYT